MEKVKEYCPGSGKLVKTEKGKKYRNYSYKYPCPECGGYYARNTDKKLSKHGYKKNGKTVERLFGFCPECERSKQEFAADDYICIECREGAFV